MTNIRNINKAEDGMVSITVTMIMMLIITLITIGFAQISRREQRQAVDNQISTQAFYAAESGINYASNPTVVDDNCTGTALELSDSVKVTCLLVDREPQDSLEYGGLLIPGVGTDESTIVPIVASTPGDINTITVEWDRNPDGGNTRNGSGFTPHGEWGDYSIGILRLNLIPTNDLSRNSLIDRTQNLFLYPSNDGTELIDNNSGLVGDCDNSRTQYKCKAVITTNGSPSYVLRMRSIYNSSKVRITAQRTGGPVQLSNAQAVIDSTGKVNDVLRRVQVRIPLSSNSGGTYPEFVLESAEDICKQYLVYSGGTGGVNSCDYNP